MYDHAGNRIQEVIWLGDLPIGVIDTNKLHYVQADHLGTPRAVIDRARDVAIWTWALQGEAFGNSPPNQDPDLDSTAFVLDMRFPGQRYDAATGLNYNYFRDYDAASGRYVQSDPIGLAGGISTFGYVGGVPTAAIDSHGLLGAGVPRIGPPTLWDREGAPRIGVERPESSRFFANYPNYDDYTDPAAVWDLIGGPAGRLGTADPEFPADTCAVRVSHALNNSGSPIPQTAPNIWYGEGGFYIPRAADMRTYLHSAWGSPDAVLGNYGDLVRFWNGLRPGQAAIVVSPRHVAVLRYESPRVS